MKKTRGINSNSNLDTIKVIAFIPARGGSVSIPLKNIKPFCGKPLIWWSLKALVDTVEVDEIFVSTDDESISSTVQSFGYGKVKIFKRSAASATATASTESAMLEFIESKKLEEETLFILVQATSPFIEGQHISEGLKLYQESKADSLLSAVRTKRFFWDPEKNRALNYDPENRPRRQDHPGWLMENGAFYISTVGNILESKNRLSGNVHLYEMPDYTGLELDEASDWMIGEALMKERLKENKNLTS